MAYKSIVVASGGAVLIPAGVTAMVANIIAGGGGGSQNAGVAFNYQAEGKGGGGSAEFAMGVRLPVVANTLVTVTVGAKGSGGVGLTNVAPTSGGTSSFGGMQLLGGNGAPSGNSVRYGGNGGGPNGGATDLTLNVFDGAHGNSESPTAWGGNAGGTGEGLGTTGGGAGGQSIGQYSTPSQANIGDEHVGGGGAATILDNGGAGSPGGNGVSASGGNGAGGGGSSGTGGGFAPFPERHQLNGGDGTGGLVQLFYSSPSA